jgi:DNA repair protein RadC
MPLSADLPRERLQALGGDPLADAELLSVVLGKRTPMVAHELLSRFPDLRRLASAGIGELAAVRGVGVAQACRVKAALALAGRLGGRPFRRGEPFTGPDQVSSRLGTRLGNLPHEVIVALALDARNRVLVEVQLARGGACGVEVVARDLFTLLLREAAVAVILIHNHPSGDPSPSVDDIRLTERLRQAGELVGIPLLDHVILAAGDFRAFSSGWNDRGILGQGSCVR